MTNQSTEDIKKVIKIACRIAAALLVLLFGLMIAAQSPKVQTFLMHKAAQQLRDKIDGDISFEKIHIRPFDAIVIKNVAVTDRNPYKDASNPDFKSTDTLFKAGYVAATFSLKGLFEHKGLHLGHVKVSDGFFALTIESNADSSSTITNIERIFRLTSDPDSGNDDEPVFDASEVELSNMEYRMRDFQSDLPPYPEGAIDWSDLRVSDINIKGRKLKLRGTVMSGIADEASMREKSGYVIRHVSGRARVGDGLALIENVRLRDNWSDINLPKLKMTYADSHAWADFIGQVFMDADISRSLLSITSLSFFAPGLQGADLTAEIEGQFKGYVNDFSVRKLNLKDLGSNINLRMEGSLTGLPDSQGMFADADIERLSFTLDELSRLIKGLSPGTDLPIGRYAPGQTFTFKGRLKGPLNRISARGRATSAIGSVSADLDIRNLIDSRRPLRIGGNLATDNLHLGKLSGEGILGECSAKASLAALFDPVSPSVKIDSLRIDKFTALDYAYSGIAAAGTYEKGAFNGKLICSDPNLNLLFQGIITPSVKTSNAIYQFYANIGYADLQALNLDLRGSTSKMSLQTMANFNMVDGKDLIGNIDIRNLLLEDSHGRHDIGDISISSHMNGNVNRVKFSSGFAEGSFVGSRFLDGFVRDLRALTLCKEVPALCRGENEIYSGSSYDLSFRFHRTKDLLSFFMPGLYIADSTSINLSIDRSGIMKGRIRSPQLAYMDKYLKGIELDISNEEDNIVGDLVSAEMNISPIRTRNNRFLMFARNNHIGLGFSYDNETEQANKGEIYMQGDIVGNGEETTMLKLEILPSNIYFNADAWSISPANIDVSQHRVAVDSLIFSNSEQSVKIRGGVSGADADTMALHLDKFDLSVLNAFIKPRMDIRGLATGKAVLTSPAKDNPGILLNLACDSTYIAGEKLGTLFLNSSWNEAQKGFDMNLRNLADGRSSISGEGLFIPRTGYIEGAVDLDRFNIGYAAPLVNTLFSSMQGSISGNLTVKGPASKPEIESKDLQIDRADLTLDFTKVPYTVSGPIRIGAGGVRFENASITDRFAARGTLTGGLMWNRLENMSLDLRIRFSEMEVLNTSERDNPDFYGNAFASGQADITGPFNAILLDINASTAKYGSFHIPMNSTGTEGGSNLLTFKQPHKDVYEDPYEAMIARLSGNEAPPADLDILLRLDVNQGTEAVIEVDKTTGNMLTGRGEGRINIEVRPRKEIFTINGNYGISSGNYHFEVLGITSKDFSIQSGSNIRFNGDIMDSDLEINALYKLKTSIGTLIADTTSTSRRTVECGLSISDKIRNPRVGFSINIPDLDPTTQAKVQTALSNDDKVRMQFLSLLISGGFLPDEQSGIANNNSMLNTTMAEIMSDQLNSILQKLEIPIDLGLDYQQSSNGSNVFDVALSTALFNNRVIVNGTIGSRKYETGTTNREMVGDLDIEIKLDRPGALRLNLFSHSADQYTNYLDNSQRNGLGLTYQQEFNTFREFFSNLFSGRKKRKAAALAREQALLNEEKVRISIKAPEEDNKDDE